MAENITADLLLNAYAQGYFPMAEDAEEDEIYWFSPEERGVIPLDGFNIPRSVKKQFKHPSFPFTFKTNTAFEEVIRACAAPVPGTDRERTWINEDIIALYCELHENGHAHSVEVWKNPSTHCHPAPVAGSPKAGSDSMKDRSASEATQSRAACSESATLGCRASLATHPSHSSHEIKELNTNPTPQLVGGLYGVSLGGAFFGESMFSRTSGASKFALIYLVALLRESGYTLLDTQYVNDHLTQFGCVEIPKTHYLSQLEKALKISPNPSSRFCTTAESSDAETLVKSMLTTPS